MDSGLKFRSLIDFEFIFFYMMSGSVADILLHINVQFLIISDLQNFSKLVK